MASRLLHPHVAQKVHTALTGKKGPVASTGDRTAHQTARTPSNPITDAQQNQDYIANYGTPAQKTKQVTGGAKHPQVTPTINPRIPLRPPSLGGVLKTDDSSTGAPLGTPVPYLTAQQQYDLNKYESVYGRRVAALNDTLTQTTAADRLREDANRQSALAQTDNANQVMAARGLFQSSIRDGALNDIDATLVQRNNLLDTAVKQLGLRTNTELGNLGSDWATTHGYYNGLAVANAQAITPDIVPRPTLGPATPAPAPGQTLSAAPHPTTPQPVAPPSSVGGDVAGSVSSAAHGGTLQAPANLVAQAVRSAQTGAAHGGV